MISFTTLYFRVNENQTKKSRLCCSQCSQDAVYELLEPLTIHLYSWSTFPKVLLSLKLYICGGQDNRDYLHWNPIINGKMLHLKKNDNFYSLTDFTIVAISENEAVDQELPVCTRTPSPHHVSMTEQLPLSVWPDQTGAVKLFPDLLFSLSRECCRPGFTKG